MTPRFASRLVASFVVIKLALTVWNCSVFDGKDYDVLHHVRRASVGGLNVDAMTYDAPTYYLPALPYKDLMRDSWRATAMREKELRAAGKSVVKKHRGRPMSPFLSFLRRTNIVYVGGFYLLWIYGVLPRVLPDWRRRTLAALLILALPGYQKLGAMVHPDNLHLFLASLCTLAWVRMPGVVATRATDPPAEGRAAVPASSGHWRLAVLAGLSGLTRPFAVATVAAFTAANLLHLAVSNRGGWLSLLGRAAAVVVLTAAIAGSWFAYRGFATGNWREAYRKGYIERFDRSGFDYVHYLTSFHIAELLEVPNRRIASLDAEHYTAHGYDPDNRYANSFFTLLYSETWGDHWLYFSGGYGGEGKLLAKRLLFALALPLVPLLGLRFLRTTAQLGRAAIREGAAAILHPASALWLQVAAGAVLFLAWQLGSALSPGKQSSVKFIYIAYLYAPAVTLCFVPRVRDGVFGVWSVYLSVLFVAALPVAFYAPRYWW